MELFLNRAQFGKKVTTDALEVAHLPACSENHNLPPCFSRFPDRLGNLGDLHEGIGPASLVRPARTYDRHLIQFIGVGLHGRTL